VPETSVQATSSDAAAGSAKWNWVGGVALLEAAGNADDEVTVHDSTVPPAGEVVPLAPVAVVEAMSVKSSSGIRLSSSCPRW
jgi:hypothetical protein